MNARQAPPTPQVSNELDVLAQLLPLQHLARHGTRLAVIELGCGNARLVREMLELGLAGNVTAMEVDEHQHAKNLDAPHQGLDFVWASATDIPAPSASFDLALMLKSLHHVPITGMAKALDEVARVLKPGGWFYVSEPVYAGALNDIVKIFNDEGLVRAAAQTALDDALANPNSPWQALQSYHFDVPVRYAHVGEFEQRMMYPTFADHQITHDVLEAVRAAFAPHCGAGGAKFVRPMHVRLLQKKW